MPISPMTDFGVTKDGHIENGGHGGGVENLCVSNSCLH